MITKINDSFLLLTHFFRGCLTQFLGGLDTDWTSFSEAIERLMTLVRSKDGIESVIKNLDGKLSEAIMHAMTNGLELEKKVSHVQHFYKLRKISKLQRPLKPQRDVAKFFFCLKF